MSKSSQYHAKTPNADGIIDWSASENEIWRDLLVRQLACIKGKACAEFNLGLTLLNFPTDKIPQLGDISKVLLKETGWQLAPVPALINFDRFFALLANKQFPVATFIRSRAEFDYLQEPDIFHELFGHCPLLTNPAFAKFTHMYGKMALAATKAERVFLARIYWFTVEFGLLNTAEGLRIYGGGILSSPKETHVALDTKAADVQRYPMDLVQALRTPYRIDILQPVYFILNSLDELLDITKQDVMSLVAQAQTLGLFAPSYKN